MRGLRTGTDALCGAAVGAAVVLLAWAALGQRLAGLVAGMILAGLVGAGAARIERHAALLGVVIGGILALLIGLTLWLLPPMP